jgi:hypothetical protein
MTLQSQATAHLFIRPMLRIGAGQSVPSGAVINRGVTCIKAIQQKFDALCRVSTCVVFRKRANPEKNF